MASLEYRLSQANLDVRETIGRRSALVEVLQELPLDVPMELFYMIQGKVDTATEQLDDARQAAKTLHALARKLDALA